MCAPAVSSLATVSAGAGNLSPVSSVEGGRESSWSPDLVEVYADRLCAVTHAFALCCSTLSKFDGRSVSCDGHVMISGDHVMVMLHVYLWCSCDGGLLPRFAEFIDKYEAVLKLLLAR